MVNLETVLTELHQNLNILQERQAKYGGNAPLDLLHQISDHAAAIDLTNQVINGELSQAEWREALRPLLVHIRDRGDRSADCQVTLGDVAATSSARSSPGGILTPGATL